MSTASHFQPSVSVVIPSYNYAAYLGDAIDSVLRQGHKPLELIVVDDGSTDSTEQVVSAYSSVAYHKQENGGASLARNAGVSTARGKLIAFLDADDIWMPYKLSKQIELLRLQPELDMIFGHVDEFYTPELPVPQSPTELRKNYPGYSACTMLIKATSFDKVGGFSTTMRVGEFIDWLFRAQDCGLKSGMVNEIVLKRRIHRNNSSRQLNCDRSEYLWVLKASIDRRRADLVASQQS